MKTVNIKNQKSGIVIPMMNKTKFHLFAKKKYSSNFNVNNSCTLIKYSNSLSKETFKFMEPDVVDTQKSKRIPESEKSYGMVTVRNFGRLESDVISVKSPFNT